MWSFRLPETFEPSICSTITSTCSDDIPYDSVGIYRLLHNMLPILVVGQLLLGYVIYISTNM